MMNPIEETKVDLLQDLHIPENTSLDLLDEMVDAKSKYVKDLRINLKNAMKVTELSPKEAALIALAIAANEKNTVLRNSFTKIALENEATKEEIAEAVGCASLLAVNNVFYRFRHFAQKDVYQKMPARIKMSLMMKPIFGKDFFELLSLAVSAVNGCEMCVRSHEESVLKLGLSEEKVFAAIRLASVVKGMSTIIF
jgi:alkyl hydroperoxide reductase subunit D